MTEWSICWTLNPPSQVQVSLRPISFSVVPSSTLWPRLPIPNWFVSKQLGFLKMSYWIFMNCLSVLQWPYHFFCKKLTRVNISAHRKWFPWTSSLYDPTPGTKLGQTSITTFWLGSEGYTTQLPPSENKAVIITTWSNKKFHKQIVRWKGSLVHSTPDVLLSVFFHNPFALV